MYLVEPVEGAERYVVSFCDMKDHAPVNAHTDDTTWKSTFGEIGERLESCDFDASLSTRNAPRSPHRDARETNGTPLATDARSMAITNFVMTAAAVAVVASLMRHDVRSSTSVLRRNMRQMRVWMEEAAADVKPGEQTKIPGADKKPPHKDPSA